MKMATIIILGIIFAVMNIPQQEVYGRQDQIQETKTNPAALEKIQAIAFITNRNAKKISDGIESTIPTSTSGFLISKDYVLTDSVIFSDYNFDFTNQAIDVRIDGKTIIGIIPNIRYLRPEYNLAIIKLAESVENIVPLSFSEKDPEIEEVLYGWGYTAKGLQGIIIKYIKKISFIDLEYLLVHSVFDNLESEKEFDYSLAGYTGSPIFNSNGDVIGIFYGMILDDNCGVIVSANFAKTLIQELKIQK